MANSAIHRDLETILNNRRLADKRLTKLVIDSLVINLVKILIEDGTGAQLSAICLDYLDVMKRFRGEIEGSITSAQALDESTFSEIQNAIESANPGKKITLERLVDVGLQSGFMLKLVYRDLISLWRQLYIKDESIHLLLLIMTAYIYYDYLCSL
eukprot:TRINITY_DN11231_c0_g1_i1.p1 TRINITY_DN11231_c0_g1~~TRINITY_DN11231_c0_g1_i1.p1  ORF type:complete len:178 (-),score=29.92 TRINITY_DN11231_c0_g1_i1:136-600(-)